MPYKFFSQQLVDKNILDLSQVFPQKQQSAQEQNNVSYNLMDIVIYLKDVTEGFKFTDAKYIDLDQAIKAIVNKYYASINEPNPFELEEDNILGLRLKTEGGLPISPRESAIVEDGKIKGKGVNKSVPLPNKVVEEVALKTPAPSDVAIDKADDVKIQQFRNNLENLQMLFDDSTLEEQDDLIKSQKKRADGLEFFIEDSEGEDVTFQKEQLKLLKNFISKNTK
jgi:hypothetical protein